MRITIKVDGRVQVVASGTHLLIIGYSSLPNPMSTGNLLSRAPSTTATPAPQAEANIPEVNNIQLKSGVASHRLPTKRRTKRTAAAPLRRRSTTATGKIGTGNTARMAARAAVERLQKISKYLFAWRYNAQFFYSKFKS